MPEVATFGEDEADVLLHAADAIVTALRGRIRAGHDIPTRIAEGGLWVELGALVEAKVELYRLMRRDAISRETLAGRLRWRAPEVDRLFDLDGDARLGDVETAFRALGKAMHVVHEPA